MTRQTLSFYDWCAAAWHQIYRRYWLDDPGAFSDSEFYIGVWRQAWSDGEDPRTFANSFAEEALDLGPNSWGEKKSGFPSPPVPFPDSAFVGDVRTPPVDPAQLDLFSDAPAAVQ